MVGFVAVAEWIRLFPVYPKATPLHRLPKFLLTFRRLTGDRRVLTRRQPVDRMRSVNVWFQVDQYISFLRVIIKILKSCAFYFIGFCISVGLVEWFYEASENYFPPFLEVDRPSEPSFLPASVLAIPIAFLVFKIVGWNPEGDAGE